MLPAPIPDNDDQRVAELHALGLLDSAPEPAFDRVTRLAQRMFDVPTVLVSLIDKDRQWFSSNVGLDATETSRDISFCGHAITGAEVMVVEDAASDERFADNPLVTSAPNIRFYAGAPIRTPTGAAIGTLCLIDSDARSMTAEEIDNLSDLAEIINGEIEHLSMANTDSLTGLLNRRGFFAACSQSLAIATREDAPISLAFIDLDGLKLVNDSLGHETGDSLICDAAGMITDAVRASDIVCRLGGDEFAVLFYGLDSANFDSRQERFEREIDRLKQTRGAATAISFSLGYAEWSRTETLAELLARGDEAMYADKLRRRSLPHAA